MNKFVTQYVHNSSVDKQIPYPFVLQCVLVLENKENSAHASNRIQYPEINLFVV